RFVSKKDLTDSNRKFPSWTRRFDPGRPLQNSLAYSHEDCRDGEFPSAAKTATKYSISIIPVKVGIHPTTHPNLDSGPGFLRGKPCDRRNDGRMSHGERSHKFV